tara:strand:+ start:650 stop:1216 length:567 start_codon:yes stop_codon:yes gene_type:complete
MYSFFLGVMICFPAGILNTWLIWGHENPDNFAFLAGFTEEPLKFLAIYLFLRKKTEFNEPMDAIVYGTVISLGFATLENFEYVYLPFAEGSLDIAILRAFTAIPMHASCGIVMGYFFGKYLFSGTKSYLAMSLLLPVFFHSLYNFLCTYSTIGMFVLLFLLIRYCYFLHRSFVRAQQLKVVEEEPKSI